MKKLLSVTAVAMASTLALAGCTTDSDTAAEGETTATATTTDEATTTESSTSEETTTEESTTDESATESNTESATESESDNPHAGHAMDGGPAPAGIAEAENPTYPIGTEVTVLADHMPGMEGLTATISGAFDTTTYSVTYQPTDGGDVVTDHRWVVHEELVDPGEAPLPDGAEITIDAEHMPGMKGAEGTVDYSTDETVYMIDIVDGEMPMTNHKWVTESELEPAQ